MQIRDDVSLGHEVGQVLLGEMLVLADSQGMAYETLPTAQATYWGILHGKSDVKIPGSGRHGPRLKNFVAVLWLENRHRQASIRECWVLEVHGSKFMGWAQELALQLEQRFVIEIIVSLVRTDTPTEMFYSDSI